MPDDESEVEWPAEGLPEVEEAPETPHDDIMKRLMNYQRSLREGASPEEAAEVMRRGVEADPGLLEASVAAESLAELLSTEAPATEPEAETVEQEAQVEFSEPEAAVVEWAEPAMADEPARDTAEPEDLETEAVEREVVEPEVVETVSESEPELVGQEVEAHDAGVEAAEPSIGQLEISSTAEPEFEPTPGSGEQVADEYAWGEMVDDPGAESAIVSEPALESIAGDKGEIEPAMPAPMPGSRAELEEGIEGLEDTLNGLAERIAELRRSFQKMAVAADDRLASLAEEVERARGEREQE